MVFSFPCQLMDGSVVQNIGRVPLSWAGSSACMEKSLGAPRRADGLALVLYDGAEEE